MIKFNVLLEITTRDVEYVAEMKITSNVYCQLFMDTNCSKTYSFAFVLELFKIYL